MGNDMKKYITLIAVTICLSFMAPNFAGTGCPCQAKGASDLPKITPVEKMLSELNEVTSGLKTYSSAIEYKVSQPLFDSQTTRTGQLYFIKDDSKSKLRINFQTIQQDEEKEEKYEEHYIFDGVWLTHIDFKMKQAKILQVAEINEANEPEDVFEAVSRHFPLIGFSKTEDLQKEFDISLIQPEDPKTPQFLQLKAKSGSFYAEDYKKIDFWIDEKSGLPGRIMSENTEDDIYEITLRSPSVNKKLKAEIFEVNVPKEFGKPEIVPLKKQEN
jgi:outer membrane lipoprotein-sorting protein